MESTLLSLVVGIISSLFATAIFLVLAEIARRIVLPWYTDKLYRGVRLDGTWRLLKLDGSPVDAAMVKIGLALQQRADVITGTYTLTGAEGHATNYHVHGIVRDRYLMATATPVSDRHLDGVAMLFYVESAESKLLMNGHFLYCAQGGEVKASNALVFAWNKA
ncbi:hypothetical protein [Cognatilysobacter lacus]|uniref:SMODS-associating 2TM beta-strand rich effector domain-containing protein n=1 Tax=Cognatilysobacter lacus TaxID=1643323 RepID=A0A5D8Z2L6_9GAMM|nr:hypothetical protein [Lysobacter lacus]TZF88342.1 hypothetical protein FW784_10040 [Lysobacter lacus]